VYVTERSAEAEALQRQLVAEIDEAAAEKERREARKVGLSGGGASTVLRQPTATGCMACTKSRDLGSCFQLLCPFTLRNPVSAPDSHVQN
jgi:hypothetical protein